MVDNLKTTRYTDGKMIEEVSDSTEWSILKDGAYCWYNNLEEEGETYGALYNWYALPKVIRPLSQGRLL